MVGTASHVVSVLKVKKHGSKIPVLSIFSDKGKPLFGTSETFPQQDIVNSGENLGELQQEWQGAS